MGARGQKDRDADERHAYRPLPNDWNQEEGREQVDLEVGGEEPRGNDALITRCCRLFSSAYL